MPVTDWNWREVKGRRSKRRPHPQLNDSEDEEQEHSSPEEWVPAVASEPSRPKAVATGVRSDTLIWLWRTREFFFKNPPQWEILVENTFIDVRSWQYQRSRTVSAPARLITSGGSTSSTARPRPRLPANFPAAPTGSPPARPEKVSALLLAAAPEPDALPVQQDVLGCMTVVKKRRGRNKFPDEIHVKTRNSQGTSDTALLQRHPGFQLESSRDFVEAAFMTEEEDETLYVDDAEEESTNDGMRPGSEDTLLTNDASTTLTKSEFAEDPNSPPVSQCGDSNPSEESAEEEADQASLAASPGAQSSKARRRARKRAAKAAARASEAAGNPQDVDAPSPKPAASKKKSKPAAAAALRMPALVTTVLTQRAAKAPAFRLSRERYSDEGFARTAWPSRRPASDHLRWDQQWQVPWSLEVTTPSSGSFPPTQRTVEPLVEEELPELEPKESAARLEQLKRRLADVQLNLQKARNDVKEQEFRNMATDHRILREMESAVRQAEMAVLREEEDLEKERRKQMTKPLARMPSSPMAAGEFSIRAGMRARAVEEASPCGDSSDAVALVSRTLARERALAVLAGGPSPERQAIVDRGSPSGRPRQAVDTATLSRSLLTSM